MTQITIVGCDLHDRSMLIQTAAGKNDPELKKFGNDTEGRTAMIEYLVQFAQGTSSSRIVFVYEASGQGFGLYDLLTDQGIECFVLSPTHLPQSAKSKKNKTDPKDAMRLLELARAHVLAGNPLPTVWTPPQRVRDDRELIRARLETQESRTRVKLKIFSMLKRYGVQVVAFEKHIRALSQTDRYQVACEYLRGLSGVGLLTAMTYLTEMGDLTRFSNRREVAAYLGLSPSSFESGESSNRKGHITRQGPGRVRKVLCQAAWAAVRRDAAIRSKWERIKGGKQGRGKIAIVAIMRHLGIVMWHMALGAGVSTELQQAELPPPSWTSA